MPTFIRVVAADGNETTITVNQIISINGTPYDDQAHPPESSLAARVTILERNQADLIHDIAVLVNLVTEQTEDPTVTDPTNTPPTSESEE